MVAMSAPHAAASPGGKGAGERLQDVERALEQGRKKNRRLQRQAVTLGHAALRLKAEMVAAAQAVQDHEQRIFELSAELDDLTHSATAETAELRRNREQVVRILIGLQRLARNPPEAMIVQPLSPSDMVRSVILLRTVVPGIERRAEDLKASLTALARTRRRMADRRDRLEIASRKLAIRRNELGVLFDRRRSQQSKTETEARAAARKVRSLARRAQSLRELLQGLREARRAPPPKKPAAKPDRAAAPTPPVKGPAASISRARGKLPFPVIGRVVGTYGQVTGTGLTRKGIVIETGPGAQVVAPYAGEVVFAGKFRGYGQLLIIEHGEGYHSLLAGLTRLSGTLGQIVLAGEPVGVMGRPKGGKPSLYLELRRDGQPINPLPWLVARKSKVSG